MPVTMHSSVPELLEHAGIVLDGLDAKRIGEASALLDQFLREVESPIGYPWDIKPDAYEAGRAALNAPTELQSALVVAAVARLTTDVAFPERPRVFQLRAFLPSILRRRPKMPELDVNALIDILASSVTTWSTWVPVQSLMKAVERSTAFMSHTRPPTAP